MKVLGKQVGSYIIKQTIGEGGYARVYLGEHYQTGQVAAIKLLDPKSKDPLDRESANRFGREIEMVREMKHPHIVPIYEAMWTEDVAYIAMHYVSHGTVQDYMERHGGGPLSVSKACTILCQVLSALQDVHARGIIHRDIKSANMLVAHEEPLTIWLSDFGIAKVLGQESFTAMNMTVGTPEYMAPEQISMGGEVTAQTDIYSAACVAYELLTGRLPFPGRNTTLLRQHLNDEPTPIHTLNARVPKPLALILERALRKDPHERYASAQIMRIALSPFADDCV